MPRQSSLRSALAHPDPDVVQWYITQIMTIYGEEQDLTPTAERLGCSRRTLERAIAEHPALSAVIDDIRNRIKATS